nr:P-II family nitrogen regulator [uncultured Holophaga sp.]
MKLITAIIKEEMLDEVREALIAVEIERITVARVSGHGRQQEIFVQRGKTIIPNLIAKVQIMIACNDEFEDLIINTIVKHARVEGGSVGDGKIFVQELKECIRIRTGERGGQAI